MEKVYPEKQWNVLFPTGDAEADRSVCRMAEDCGVSKSTAKLYYNRRCRCAEDVRTFLRNDMVTLYDPFLLKDMDVAVDRVLAAVRNHEKIAIYGDYDVDGVTSVTLLYLYLASLGADVGYYIPSRDREGYGVSCGAVDRLAAAGVTLMITVDTGITANDEVDHAAACGIETVVTDHHERRDPLPAAVAVVNPHRTDCPYPFKDLAGVGVVFKLVCAIRMTLDRANGASVLNGLREICDLYADLVAVGTIADVMPLLDENRLVVIHGLEQLEKHPRLGFSALIAEASSQRSDGKEKKRKINSSFIGYTLAPRINAAGRISSASKAVELLLSVDYDDAVQKAQELCAINTRRQEEENRIAEQAAAKIEATCDLSRDHVIVLEDDSWMQGIIGIVSSRITEKYGLPSILISFDGTTRGIDMADDVGKGSGRSIKGMNLVQALTACEDLLVRFGGHELAAGLSIKRNNIPAFRERLNALAVASLGSEKPVVSECEVAMEDLSMNFMDEISCMEPFGTGNPMPNFVLRGARVDRISAIGGGKHTKLMLSAQGRSMTAVWFSKPASLLPFSVGDTVDVLFTLNVNEFQNETTLQMLVGDVHADRSADVLIEEQKEKFIAVCDGASFTAEDDFVPSREDVAFLYLLLKKQNSAGHTAFSEKVLYSMVQADTAVHMNYVKMRFIIRILRELDLCGAEEPSAGFFVFSINKNAAKTSIEKSVVLQKLRAQCRTTPLSL